MSDDTSFLLPSDLKQHALSLILYIFALHLTIMDFLLVAGSRESRKKITNLPTVDEYMINEEEDPSQYVSSR